MARPRSSLLSFQNRPTQKLWVVAVLLATMQWGWMRPAIAQEILQRVLTVTGQGEEMIAATEANVNLAVEVTGKSANEVQSEVARRADAVVNYLRSQNVQKLQTTGINLNPIYDYSDGKQRITGYQGSNSVSFKVAANRSGAIIDRAVATGATSVNGVSFSASESEIDSAQKRALQEATQDARGQAQAILSVLGLSEQEIIGIQVNGSTPAPVFVARTAKLEAADAPTTPVVPGEQTVNASVTLQIRY